MFLYQINSDDDGQKGTWEICGYWNNASQIHKFFYDNVIKGGDPYTFYTVDKELLDKLKLLCFIILMNIGSGVENDVAKALLPLDKNCLSANRDIDEDYFLQIEQTHDILENIIENDALFIYKESR